MSYRITLALEVKGIEAADSEEAADILETQLREAMKYLGRSAIFNQSSLMVEEEEGQ